MISRRSLLRASTAALAIPATARALPMPMPIMGWNPNHPACQGQLFSFAPQGGAATVRDMVRKQNATITGSPTYGFTSGIGNSIIMGTTNHIDWTNRATIVEVPSTTWLLFETTSLAAAQSIWLSGSNFITGVALQIAITSGLLQWIYPSVSNNNLTGLSVVANAPYLLIVSIRYNSATTTTLNALLYRLDTGAIATYTANISSLPVASNGTYRIGATSSGNNAVAANIACLNFSRAWLPLSAMGELISNPWGPWSTSAAPLSQTVNKPAVSSGNGKLISVP